MNEYRNNKNNFVITPQQAGQMIEKARADGYTGNIYIIINGYYYEVKGRAEK